MKSPIQYFGAKGNIAELIVDRFPPHEAYVEPYAGSLAVLLAKPVSRVEVVNDLDDRLMTFWRVLRDRPEDLDRAAALTPHSRTELAAATALEAVDELELARQVWVTLTQGRSRTLMKTGWRFFADPAGAGASFAKYMDAYRERLAPAAERLRNVSLECRPALEIIRQYGAAEGNLLYVDPPYDTSTRRGGRYAFEMSHADHLELSEALRECRATVVLSGYDSDLYREVYADWDRVQIATRTNNSTSPDRTEVLWSNRALDEALFSFSDFGAEVRLP